MTNYVKFNSLTLRAKGGVMKLLFKMFISTGVVWVISLSVMTLGVGLGHISSISLEVGLLMRADW